MWCTTRCLQKVGAWSAPLRCESPTLPPKAVPANTSIPVAERAEAEAAFVQLIEALAGTGFATEVRPGEGSSLLVFLKIASDKLLRAQIYRYRLQDWLYGVRSSAPNQNLEAHMAEEPMSEAERLRLAYLLITKPKNEGGAGITPKTGQWKHVVSIFPLHDHAFNRTWITQWSTKYKLDESDLNAIRDRFGEKIAFYFAFLQAYSSFLLFPAAFGFGAWMLLGQYSWLYGIVNCLWSVVFFEYWKKKEEDLAVPVGCPRRVQDPAPPLPVPVRARGRGPGDGRDHQGLLAHQAPAATASPGPPSPWPACSSSAV